MAETEFLKIRVGYVWNRINDHIILSAYVIGTWSRYAQWSEDEKHSSAQEKKNLPQIAVQNEGDERKCLLLSLCLHNWMA